MEALCLLAFKRDVMASCLEYYVYVRVRILRRSLAPLSVVSCHANTHSAPYSRSLGIFSSSSYSFLCYVAGSFTRSFLRAPSRKCWNSPYAPIYVYFDYITIFKLKYARICVYVASENALLNRVYVVCFEILF